jgi:hypothetical protein
MRNFVFYIGFALLAAWLIRRPLKMQAVYSFEVSANIQYTGPQGVRSQKRVLLCSLTSLSVRDTSMGSEYCGINHVYISILQREVN